MQAQPRICCSVSRAPTRPEAAPSASFQRQGHRDDQHGCDGDEEPHSVSSALHDGIHAGAGRVLDLDVRAGRSALKILGHGEPREHQRRGYVHQRSRDEVTCRAGHLGGKDRGVDDHHRTGERRHADGHGCEQGAASHAEIRLTSSGLPPCRRPRWRRRRRRVVRRCWSLEQSGEQGDKPLEDAPAAKGEARQQDERSARKARRSCRAEGCRWRGRQSSRTRPALAPLPAVARRSPRSLRRTADRLGHLQEDDGAGELQRQAGRDRRHDLAKTEHAPPPARQPDQQRMTATPSRLCATRRMRS